LVVVFNPAYVWINEGSRIRGLPAYGGAEGDQGFKGSMEFLKALTESPRSMLRGFKAEQCAYPLFIALFNPCLVRIAGGDI